MKIVGALSTPITGRFTSPLIALLTAYDTMKKYLNCTSRTLRP